MADAETAVLPVNQIVKRYIALRDKKDEHKKAFKKATEAIDEALARCEAFLMEHMNASGADSIKTEFGTPYKSVKTSAPVADWGLLLEWIKANESWEALEHRISKEFVVAYKDEHNDLPPGVNWRAETVINVRRA